MNTKYKLSKSNKIYLGTISGLIILSFLAFSSKEAYKIGMLVGTLGGLVLFPAIFGWVAWLISGKKEGRGSYTFNIVLTLVIFGQVNQISTKAAKRSEIEKIAQESKEFKALASEASTTEEFDVAYRKYADSVQDGFEKLEENSHGNERKLYQILGEVAQINQRANKEWLETVNAIESARILDYSRLVSDQEFSYQIGVINDYVEKSREFKQTMKSFIPNLRKKLSVLGENNHRVKAAIKGAKDKHNLQWPIIEPLVSAHIEYGSNMMEMLEVLKSNKSVWRYEDNNITVDDSKVLLNINRIHDAITKNEKVINELSGKLLNI